MNSYPHSVCLVFCTPVCFTICYTAAQNQKAVSAHFTNKQILPFGLYREVQPVDMNLWWQRIMCQIAYVVTGICRDYERKMHLIQIGLFGSPVIMHNIDFPVIMLSGIVLTCGKKISWFNISFFSSTIQLSAFIYWSSVYFCINMCHAYRIFFYRMV